MSTYVALLLLLLGTSSFKMREAAHSSLASLGYAAWPQLELAIHSRAPEVATRAFRIVQPWRESWLENQVSYGKPLVWFDKPLSKYWSTGDD